VFAVRQSVPCVSATNFVCLGEHRRSVSSPMATTLPTPFSGDSMRQTTLQFKYHAKFLRIFGERSPTMASRNR
jgi:hypothetical protein